MSTVYWRSRSRPSRGTNTKRQARRRGFTLAAMPTAIITMYTRDNILVAKKAATSRLDMASSRPQFCAQQQRYSTLMLVVVFLAGNNPRNSKSDGKHVATQISNRFWRSQATSLTNHVHNADLLQSSRKHTTSRPETETILEVYSTEAACKCSCR